MKIGIPTRSMVWTALLAGALLSGCASGKKGKAEPGESPQAVTASNDILELLTGFGESVSKRDFDRAVEFLVPEERALMRDSSGKVPEDKQKALMALSLQRLIRDPAVHADKGYLAGIHAIISRHKTVLAQDSTADFALSDSAMVAQAGDSTTAPIPLPAMAEAASLAAVEAPGFASGNDPLLQEATRKFFSAIRQGNWSAAMALVHDNEKRAFLDDKGRLTESSKARLSRIDAENKDALMLLDGKLTGVSLIVPSK